MTVADPRGASPLRTKNFLNFMQFLGKSGKFVCWRPPRSWRPLLREILYPPLAPEILDLLVSLQYIEMIFVITYSLPELPYPQDGLAPWIEAQTIDVHYNGHHKAYATNMNAALQKWREEVM